VRKIPRSHAQEFFTTVPGNLAIAIVDAREAPVCVQFGRPYGCILEEAAIASLAHPQLLLRPLQFGDLLNRGQYLRFSREAEPDGGKQKVDLLSFAGRGERQARFHLQVTVAGSHRVEDGAAQGAGLAERPVAAASGVVQRIQTAHRLAATPPHHLGLGNAGTLFGKFVRLANASSAVHYQHHERSILVDRVQLLLVLAQGLLGSSPIQRLRRRQGQSLQRVELSLLISSFAIANPHHAYGSTALDQRHSQKASQGRVAGERAEAGRGNGGGVGQKALAFLQRPAVQLVEVEAAR